MPARVRYAEHPATPVLHRVLAFSALNTRAERIRPEINWDMRFALDFASLAAAPGRRIPSSVLDTPATNPPVSTMRIVCNLFPFSDWRVKVVNPRGVTVGDVLDHLYKTLRTGVHHREFERLPLQNKAYISEAFYSRVRRSPNPDYEKQRGVRRVDFLQNSTVFVGLTPSPDAEFTWHLTVKRAR